MASNTEQRKIEILVNGQKANASVKEMEAAVALLNNQWKKTERGTEEYVQKTEELKAAKQKLADVRKEVSGVDAAQNKLTKSIGGVSEAQNEALGYFSDMIPYKAEYDMLNNKVGLFSKNIGGVSKQFGVLKIAIASTGLGLLIVVLGSLVTWLTSTQEGMDKVTSVTRPLMAIFERLIGVVQNLGGKVFKGLASAINDPKQALIDLGDIIKDNVMARLESFGVAGQAIVKILKGDFAEGFKELGDAAIMGTTGIRNGTDMINDAIKGTADFINEGVEAGKRIDELTKQIERSEITMATSKERLNRIFEEQKFIAEDSTKTEKERVAAARAAQAAQDQLLGMEQNLLDLRIEKMQIEQSLNDTSREGELEMAELLGQREKLEAQAVAKKKEARNQENSILQQGIAAEKAAAAEVAKAKEEALKTELAAKESIEDLKIALIRDKFEQEIAQVELDTERKIEALTGSEEQITEQRLLLEQQREERLLELQEEQKIAREEKALEEMELKLEQEEELEELEREKLQLKFEEALLTEQQRDLAFLDLERATAAEKLKILEEAGKGETAQAIALKAQILKVDKEKNATLKQQAQDRLDFEANMQSLRVQTAGEAADFIIGFLNEESQAFQVAKAIRKAIGLAEIALNLQKEMSLNAVNAAANPLNAVTAGAAGATQLAISNTLSIVRAAVASAAIVGFAKGGYTGSGLSIGSKALVDHTGYRVAGVVHQDEWVSPKWMVESPKYANVIGWLEGERRRGFAEGGYTSEPPIPSGSDSSASVVAEQAAEQSLIQQELLMNISQKLDELNASVQAWPQVLRIVNPITDIVDGIQAYNDVNADSEIRA